jgi:hypothetical protein
VRHRRLKGRIYRCSIDFSRAISAVGADCPDFVAFCAAKSLSPGTLGDLLAVLERAADPLVAARTIHAFFQFFGPFLLYEPANRNGLTDKLLNSTISETIFGQLDQMSEDYPSAGQVSRADYFWRLLRRRMEQPGERQIEKVALKVMDEQLRQNAVSAAIEEALKQWSNSHPVDPTWLNMVCLIVAKEIELYSFPVVRSIGKVETLLSYVKDMEWKNRLNNFYATARKMLEMSANPVKTVKEKTVVGSSLPNRLDLDSLVSLSPDL